MQPLPEKKAESQRKREILRQMHFQPKRIRVCAMPTRIIIPVWKQRILPKVQRKAQPVPVPGSNMVESCGSTKSWSGWRKRQIKMPWIPSLRNAWSLIRRLARISFPDGGRSRPSKKSMPLRRQVRPLRRTQQLAQPKLRRVLPV